MGSAAALVRVQVALDQPASTSSRASRCATSRSCCWRSSRPASPPAPTSSTSFRSRSGRRATYLAASRSRTPTAGRCTTRWPSPEQAHELLRRIVTTDEIETEDGRFGFHAFDESVIALESAPGPAHGRRAVELLDRVRRADRSQGVPQARARRQPGARGPALPHLSRLPEHRAAVRLVRLRGAGVRGDARRGPGVPARRRRRLGARPGRDRDRARDLPRDGSEASAR